MVSSLRGMKQLHILKRSAVRLLLLLGPVFTGAYEVSAQNVTITRKITAGTDDVEENIGGSTPGFIYNNSSDLELMLDGSQNQHIGVRFTGLSIPQGATIQRAFIQFSTKGDKAPVSGTITIKGQNADNAATFGTTAYDVSSRSTTSQSVSWPGSTSTTWGTTAGGTRGADQRTPDLKTVVQAIVSRSGWSSGNAMAFVFSGAGVRNAYSFDGSATLAPELIVQYTTATPGSPSVGNLPIAKGSDWKYLDDGTSQDFTAWKNTSFNDASWSRGPAKLGYSDNAVTVLDFGPSATNKYITYYFRKQFNVTSIAAIGDSLEINVLRDDAAVIYINGTEVVRSNLPTGTFNYMTFSSTIVDNADETTYYTYHIHKSVLVAGTNTIAVEVHQRDGTSSDLGFDLELRELPAPSIIRGPYLQAATSNSIHVRWRTDIANNSRVRYGLAANALDSVVSNSANVTEHELVLNNLTPHTKYWYSIESLTDTLQADTSNYFVTNRIAGDTSLVRIGVFGDCGNNSTNQINVRNQVLNYLGNNYMDSWILLGDNAYSNGTDAEFQAEFFNIYRDRFLKQNPLYPAPGNHDYNNGSTTAQANHAVPYYTIFSMPTQGEAGGVPSNNQAYYSFNQGNVHFLSLDSYGKEDAGTTRMYDTLGAQVQWIKADLAANTNKGWVVAYWHHPPYTMGSHNSDSETELVKTRENFIRILERMGVDLILCGHSHDYERSRLMKGHYGNEASFNAATHNLSSSSGLYDNSVNSCPYVKDSVANFQGTVYVVSGSAGQLGGQQTSFPHAALSAYSNATNGGAMMLEVRGNRLDAKWINADGQIRDRFTMMKNAVYNKTYTINEGDSIALTAGFNGNYVWTNTPSTGKTINVSPTDTTTYIVNDGYGCIADSFIVNVIPKPVMSNCPANITVASNGNCGAVVNFTPPTATDIVPNCSVIPANLLGNAAPLGTFQGHTYYLMTNANTWSNHDAYAASIGAHLVSIGSAQENAFISSKIGNDAFIGFSDASNEGTFTWTSGETITYNNFCSPEPNGGTSENYAFIKPNGCWVDIDGQTYRSAIIEFDCTASDVTPKLTAGIAPGNTFPVGTTTVTYTATGYTNASAVCSFTVTVTDATAPTFTNCPQNITVNADAATCSAVVSYASPVAADGCSACAAPAGLPIANLIGIHKGHTYFLSGNYNTWDAHKSYIESIGGHLVSVNGPDEQAFLAAYNAGGYSAWIGLTDAATEGTFVWTTGEPVGYTNWCTGEPNGGTNENHGVFTSTGNCWTDYNGSNYLLAIYEFDCANNAAITPVRTGGLASGSAFPVGTTTVMHTATDASSNTATCSFTVTVVDPTNTCTSNARMIQGVAGAEFAVTAYPNPFKDGMHLRFESSSFTTADVIIHDVTGRTIETRLSQTVDQDIVLGNELSAGVYILEVRSGNASQKVRIAKVQ